MLAVPKCSNKYKETVEKSQAKTRKNSLKGGNGQKNKTKAYIKYKVTKGLLKYKINSW